jgi:transcriptional regulator with XRE-family HTH domain
MARAALGWGVRELGKKAGISPNTVSRFENGAGAMVETLTLIQAALEGAGVVFISADDTGGPGVRLAKKGPKQKGR